MRFDRAKCLWSTSLAAALSIGAAGGAKGAVLDFETPNQYTDNFRQLFSGNFGAGIQSNNGVDNDVVTVLAGKSATMVYDTTPADAAEKSVFTVSHGSPVTVTADVRFGGATSSFGVYIVDAANEANGYLALFNINQNSTTGADLIRFSGNGAPNAGTAGTLNAGTSGEALDLNTFGTVQVTYSIDADNHPALSLSVGSFSDSFTFASISNPLTSVEVALRDSAQNGGTGDFDNFNVTGTTPEPAATAILGFAGLALLRRRRHGRKGA
jgi:MYXO-CTERM domain-containing protein